MACAWSRFNRLGRSTCVSARNAVVCFLNQRVRVAVPCRVQVVARGAAGAPGATEALVQQALAGEPGHPAAERHAASLLAAAEAGRARSAMSALPGPPSGAPNPKT